MSNPVQAPAEAVREVAGLFRELTNLLREWIAGADTRRMKAAIDTAETYIRTASMVIKDKLPEKDHTRKDLEALEYRFFKLN